MLGFFLNASIAVLTEETFEEGYLWLGRIVIFIIDEGGHQYGDIVLSAGIHRHLHQCLAAVIYVAIVGSHAALDLLVCAVTA